MDHSSDSTPLILLLPPELKHQIATELSSPDSLAALARTHTSFQRNAEQALYHTLSIEIFDDIPLCLEVLAENSKKATFVRSLMIIRHPYTNKNRMAIPCLTKALVNTHTLSDLRIKLHPIALKGWIENLDNVLCEGHFQLKTLYCDNTLDIPRIINSQTKLQILGIYTSDVTINLLKTLKHFHDAQLFCPTIFTLKRESYHPSINRITIFPAFYSVDRTTTIHQLLTKSLGEDQTLHWEVGLSMYLTDSSDMPSIHALAKGMAGCFSRIWSLSFLFERPCEIPPHKMKEVLSLFPNLREVIFCLWPGYGGNVDPKISKDDMVAHAKIWGECPELVEVRFSDGSLLEKEDGWSVFRTYSAYR